MPLIQCPDCYNQISDRAPTCPYCGAPMAAGQLQTPPGQQVMPYQAPPTPMPQAQTPPPMAAPQMMRPAQYAAQQAAPPPQAGMMPPGAQQGFHDPRAAFVDPEEPFRNNSLAGVIKGQASFRATFLWWLVGFAGFSFLAFDEQLRLAIVPAVIWFWGGIFLMFWNARNIYNGKLKTIVFWALGIIFVLMIIGAAGR